MSYICLYFNIYIYTYICLYMTHIFLFREYHHLYLLFCHTELHCFLIHVRRGTKILQTHLVHLASAHRKISLDFFEGLMAYASETLCRTYNPKHTKHLRFSNTDACLAQVRFQDRTAIVRSQFPFLKGV